MKSPAFQFYVKDWLSSSRITMMTPAQEGAYIRLLCYDWDNDGLPDNDDALSNLSRLGEGWFNGGSTVVKPCFVSHPSKLGFITSERLQSERKKQAEWAEKSRLGGVKSGELRRCKTKGGSTTVGKGGCVLVEPNGNIASASASANGNTYIEPPAGFPASQEAAKNYTGAVGCPPEFAMNLWNDLAAVGWKDGAGREISSFQHYLAKRWRESQQTQPRPSSAQCGASTQGPSESVKMIMAQKELDRVEARLEQIKEQAAHTALGIMFTPGEKKERAELINRKVELKKQLGFQA